MKKMNKKIIITLLLSVLLTGCWSNKEIDNTSINETTNNIKNNSKETKLDTTITKELQIEFDSNWVNVLPKWWKIWSDNKNIESPKIEIEFIDDTLSIWGDVTIKEWKAQDFPADFPIIPWWQIYNNSNMKEYWIIIVDKEITEIEKFYIKGLEKLWWKNNSDEELEENGNLDSKFLVFIKEKENNIYKEVKIDISSIIPTVIKESFNVEWKFIEISFDEVFILDENWENN